MQNISGEKLLNLILQLNFSLTLKVKQKDILERVVILVAIKLI
jgi:hypothetical protein